MGDRKKACVHAAGLTLFPIALVFSVIGAAHFEVADPAKVWLVAAFALVAMWIETRAIAELLGMYRNRRDPFLIAIVPLGLISLGAYAFSGTLLLLALPTIIHRLI